MKIKLLLLAAIIMVACDPSEWLESHKAVWYIKNMTDAPLNISCSQIKMESGIVAPGDSIFIYNSGRYLGNNEYPPFDDLLKIDSIYVYDANGNELCEWLQANKEIESRNIFKEDVWTYYQEPFSGPEYIFTWVFDITAEDIANTVDVE